MDIKKVRYVPYIYGAPDRDQAPERLFLCFFCNPKVNGNHEMATQKRNLKNYFSRRDLKHGPLEPKASVLPTCYLFRVPGL